RTVPRNTNRSCLIGPPTGRDSSFDASGGGRGAGCHGRRGGGRGRRSDGYRGEDLSHDAVRVDLTQRGLALDDQAVGKDRDGQRLHVIGNDVIAPLHCREGLRRAVEVERAAWRCPQVDVGMLPGRGDEPDDVLGNRLIDVDLLDGGLHLPQLVHVEHLLHRINGMDALLLVEDDDLLHRLRIADAQPQHEAIELCLGQREGAFVFDGVLGGDHQEGRRHRVGDPVDRRLALRHALEQRALGLGRGAVDLVGEDHLGHDRAWPELELLRLLVEDGESRHIGREQVRGELDAPERAADAAADGLGEHRLADTRHILDQDVALAEERDEGHADFAVLADDDALDVRDHALCRLLDVLHRFLDFMRWIASRVEASRAAPVVKHNTAGRYRRVQTLPGRIWLLPFPVPTLRPYYSGLLRVVQATQKGAGAGGSYAIP